MQSLVLATPEWTRHETLPDNGWKVGGIGGGFGQLWPHRTPTNFSAIVELLKIEGLEINTVADRKRYECPMKFFPFFKTGVVL